jgi:hypothetical protein
MSSPVRLRGGMTEPTPSDYVPVSRELVYAGILPWAGPKYEEGVRKLLRDNPYDRLVFMVPERLLDVYRDHPPANHRMTAAEAVRLGLEAVDGENPNSFINRVRRALGNPN